MLTIIYVIILILIVLLPLSLIHVMDKRQKRRERSHLLQQFHEAAQEENISVSSQEVLHNLVFGLDGTQRKLLLLSKQRQGHYYKTVIDLNEVTDCRVITQHSPSAKNWAGAARPLSAPVKLSLLLTRTGKPPVEIVFYVQQGAIKDDVAALEAKALRWEAVLLKLLPAVKRA